MVLWWPGSPHPLPSWLLLVVMLTCLAYSLAGWRDVLDGGQRGGQGGGGQRGGGVNGGQGVNCGVNGVNGSWKKFMYKLEDPLLLLGSYRSLAVYLQFLFYLLPWVLFWLDVFLLPMWQRARLERVDTQPILLQV